MRVCDKDISIGCIGCGTMGGAVIKAIARQFGTDGVCVSAAHFDRARRFADGIGVAAEESNLALAERSDCIFLAVKPAYIKDVLQEIRPAFSRQKLVVSMAAGLTLSTLHESCRPSELSAPDAAFVMPHLMRIMPNLPATFGESMTALCAASSVTEDELCMVKALLAAAGKVEQVPEKLMDGVTAVSGSGPAYAFMFIEALADAAVKFGMPRKQAYVYAAQTLKGAAVMALEDGRSPAELKDAVCSPAGTTIDAVVSLERHGFRSAVIEAAVAAFSKSVELGRR